MASTKLTRTPSSAGNRKTWTYSAWIKISDVVDSGEFLTSGEAGVTDLTQMKIDSGDFKLKILQYNPSLTASTNIQTSRVFRDVSAWYHIVIAVDTTQATSSDRVKIYVNGVQETSFSTATYPAQNFDFSINYTQEHTIGSRTGTSAYFSGIMSHIHLIDGTAYDASTFGETDANGVWKPKTSPSVTYGTNGFFLKMENSGSMGTDSSGNGNNFTVNGNLTQTLDTPSNVYCTFNGINPYSGTLSNGNLKMSQTSYDYNVQGTLGMEAGKWYWEVKMFNTHGEFGVCEQGKANQSDPQNNAGFYFLYNNGNTTGYIFNNPTSGGAASTITCNAFTSGMIINFAYDADNQALYIGQNGTWLNSGDPTSGASKTGALITNVYPRFSGTIVPFVGHGTNSFTGTAEANFGNGYFGTTAVSSAGSNGNGSIFEYDVPTGYYALNTKNLATYG